VNSGVRTGDYSTCTRKIRHLGKVLVVCIEKDHRKRQVMALFRSVKALDILARGSRSIWASSAVPAKQNLDPIQELFVNKLAEYKTKSKGGKLVDAGEEADARREKEIAQLQRRYGGDSKQLEEFPKFNFAQQ
jgi:F-type H+-transporting ATPase subunit 6